MIPIGANRDAATAARVEITRVSLPLFLGASLEELLIEFPTNLRNHDLFRVLRMLDRNPVGHQPGLHFLAGGGVPDELLERMEIDREMPQPAIGPGPDLVFYRMPLGELGEIIADLR